MAVATAEVVMAAAVAEEVTAAVAPAAVATAAAAVATTAVASVGWQLHHFEGGGHCYGFVVVFELRLQVTSTLDPQNQSSDSDHDMVSVDYTFYCGWRAF